MHRRILITLLFALLTCVRPAYPEEPAPKQTVYDFSLVDMDGKVVPLSTYKGKLLLIVNVASKSLYHDQLDALSELQKSYADKGLVVIGVPSPDFGGEELKDAAAVRQYYDDAHLSFPVFAPATLHGVHTIPLYKFLCNAKESVPGGDIHWNFTKFLIDRKGAPLARYEVGEDPAEVSFHVLVENALDGKLKKKGADKSKDNASEGDDDED